MNGYEIKKVRRILQFTQEEFAHQIGVTLSTVNRWENNKSRPSKLAQKQIHQIVEQLQYGHKFNKIDDGMYAKFEK